MGKYDILGYEFKFQQTADENLVSPIARSVFLFFFYFERQFHSNFNLEHLDSSNNITFTAAK